jgi:hypothetical protein
VFLPQNERPNFAPSFSGDSQSWTCLTKSKFPSQKIFVLTEWQILETIQIME